VRIAGVAVGIISCGCGLAGCSDSNPSQSASAPQNAAGQNGTPQNGAGQNAAGQNAAGTADGRAAALPAGSTALPSGSAALGPAGFSNAGGAGAAQSATSARLVPATQSVIYTAQLSVRAKSVTTALSQATRIVAAAGGYVSSEDASDSPNDPAKATATVTFKVPVPSYQPALARLDSGSVGTQLSLRQRAQDVTQQVADVGSQVASDQAALAQLRGLLKHAGSVDQLLDVQNQINSEEGQLEAMEAQQKALDGETAYATVMVTIAGPNAPVAKSGKPAPPPGLASSASGGWHAFTLTIDWLLAVIGAVAPFAAVLALLALTGWWIRRRLRRAPPPTIASK